MRLHRLTLTAFGPFPGTEEIDFDALSADGLFLLHGRTGSGKTTVLDAVTFALYGDVPGQRDVAGLHSHHAPPEREPSVELEFTQADRRWLIRRTPPYERPSRRARTGTVSQNQTVLLKVHDGDQWQAVTSGVQAASKEIQDILPLDRHQFTKVILLPQGEFAQFLHANSTEKQKLLQKLFDTTVYQRLESELHERSRALRSRVERAEQRVESAAEAARDQARAMLAPSLGEDLARFDAVAPEDLEQAVELLGAWAARDHDQDVELAAAEDEHAAGRAAELRRRRTLLEALAAHQERVRAHEARQESVEWGRTALARHQQAQQVRRWFDQAESLEDGAQSRLAAAQHAAAGLREELAAQDDVDAGGASAAQLLDDEGHPATSPLQRVLTELTGLRGALQEKDGARLERRRREAAAERTDAQQRAEAQRQAEQDADQRLETLQQRQQKMRDAWADAERLEARRTARAEALSLHRRRLELLEARDSRTGALEQEEARAAEAAAREQEAAARRRTLLTGHLRAVARRLAADLVPGEPCSVCGAVEHPAPAHTSRAAPDAPESADRESPDQADVTEEDVEQATEALHRAARARAAAETTVDSARQSLRDLDAQAASLSAQLRLAESAAEVPVEDAPPREARDSEASDDAAEPLTVERAPTVEQASTELAAAERRHQEADAAVKEQRRREAAWSDLLQEIAEVGQTRQTARLVAEQAGQQVARLDQEIRDAEETLSGLRGSHGSVADRLSSLETLETSARAVETAGAAWREATGAAAQARRSAWRQLEESPLEDLQQLESALLGDEQEREHRERIDAWDREAQRIAVAEESDELAEAKRLSDQGHVAPPEEVAVAAELEAQQAAARSERARAVRDRFADRRRSAAEAVARLGEALEVRDGELADHRRLADLAATLNGSGPDNPRRMTLTGYVLAARLEKVAEAATRHLQTMSEGRYRLLHEDSDGSGRRQGLDLKVHDEHSDHERPTSSLSGGETFMASLAMALGLAEVVQSEAGGVGLESLFIDEGFGSLDEESLDHVMAALHRLQGEGRRVGVVSHVTEMHRAIPSQLRVIRRRTGSTARMVIPGVIDSPQHVADAESPATEPERALPTL